jgi:hypothetical protein
VQSPPRPLTITLLFLSPRRLELALEGSDSVMQSKDELMLGRVSLVVLWVQDLTGVLLEVAGIGTLSVVWMKQLKRRGRERQRQRGQEREETERPKETQRERELEWSREGERGTCLSKERASSE